MQGKTLYYECFSGISGDMNLAAMLALGVPQAYLEGELAKLGLAGWKLRVEKAAKKGIHGLRVAVDLGGEGFRPIEPKQAAAHRSLRASHPKSTDHGHRTFADIKNLIHQSSLSSAIQEKAIAIFFELAKAEATVHAMEVETVHFHEVGAVDSIVDIVGAAICFDWLKPSRVICSPVQLGGGMVSCQHGLIPVPAPAVVELLRGVPIKTGGADKETTTPTGAAILRTLVDEFVLQTSATLMASACGIGHRDLEIPNLLRVSLLEEGDGGTLQAQAMLLECNIDDMSGEMLGPLIGTFLDHGASDAWLTPIIMKKNRPAHMFSVLCATTDAQRFALLILKETSSLGVRHTPFTKTMLERNTVQKETSLGPVTVKRAFLDGEFVKQKPEFEDVQALAQKHGLSLFTAAAIINQELD